MTAVTGQDGFLKLPTLEDIMNSNPTPATVLAAILAGRDSFDAYSEDGSSHYGMIAKRTDKGDASDVVIKFETTDGTEHKTGTFLIAVRRLDPDNSADVAVVS